MAEQSLERKCARCKEYFPKDYYPTIVRKTGYVYYNKKCKRCISEIAIINRKKRTSTPEGMARHKILKSEWNRKNRHKYADYPSRKKQKIRKARISIKFRKERQLHLERGRLSIAEAWSDWLSLAGDEWLDKFYSIHPKPWVDRRLSRAESERLRRKLSPEFAIYDRLRSAARKQSADANVAESMRLAIRQNGESNKVQAICGYTIAELKRHIESKFVDGMSWEKFNDGQIHIDHIIPKSVFKCSNRDELIDCWSLDNLQPLWAKENLKKKEKACAQDACPILWMKYGSRVKKVESEPIWLEKVA